jgi:hypothetical protein
MHNESHAASWRNRLLSDILKRMRHEGASSRPVRRIVLLGGTAPR